jgi:hypothetical protein
MEDDIDYKQSQSSNLMELLDRFLCWWVWGKCWWGNVSDDNVEVLEDVEEDKASYNNDLDDKFNVESLIY